MKFKPGGNGGKIGMSKSVNWSEQELIDHGNMLSPQGRRAVAEYISASLSPAEPDYERDRVYRVTRANQARAVKASGALRIPKGMNKTEQRYALHLEVQKRAGAVLWYKFEGITLKLADDTRYTPDFAVLGCGGNLELHEVKGFWRDDAKVKIKIAAEMFPFEFLAIFAEKGGKWRNEHF